MPPLQLYPGEHGAPAEDVLPGPQKYPPPQVHVTGVAAPPAHHTPAAQGVPSGLVEPAWQYAPGTQSHGPEHVLVFAPAPPQNPASQSPAHDAEEYVAAPAPLPYAPGAQGLATPLPAGHHVPACAHSTGSADPPAQTVPRPQRLPVGDVDPAAHARPDAHVHGAGCAVAGKR